MKELKIVHSIVDPKSLLEWAYENYDIPKDLEAIIYSYKKTEYYFLHGKESNFFLKVYGISELAITHPEHCSFEVDLIQHLRQNQLDVPELLKNKKNEYISQIHTPEGPRKVILYEYIDAETKLCSQSRSILMGDSLGRFHLATNNLDLKTGKINLDLEYLLEGPIERFNNSKILEFEFAIEQLIIWCKEIKHKLSGLEKYKSNWGVVHGNFHTRNCLFTNHDDKLFLMDFTDSGYSWRHYDLATFALSLWHEILEANKSTDLINDYNIIWNKFLTGYTKHLSLSDMDIKTIPYLMIAKELWKISIGLIPPFKDFNDNNSRFSIHVIERLLDDVDSGHLFK